MSPTDDRGDDVGHWEVTRSTTIKADAERIHGLINDFREWRKWSPWEDLDPNLERIYSGEKSGKGAAYAWSGNTKAGQGDMEILSSEPERVSIEVRFTKPFKAVNQSAFELDGGEATTEVTWRMHGTTSRLMGLVGKVWPMEKFVGGDIEKGLRQLKSAAES